MKIRIFEIYLKFSAFPVSSGMNWKLFPIRRHSKLRTTSGIYPEYELFKSVTEKGSLFTLKRDNFYDNAWNVVSIDILSPFLRASLFINKPHSIKEDKAKSPL